MHKLKHIITSQHVLSGDVLAHSKEICLPGSGFVIFHAEGFNFLCTAFKALQTSIICPQRSQSDRWMVQPWIPKVNPFFSAKDTPPTLSHKNACWGPGRPELISGFAYTLEDRIQGWSI